MQQEFSGLTPGGATTDYALAVLAILAAGGDPRRWGQKETDLVGRLRDAQRPDGKFGDTADGRGEELVNAHVWAVIALAAAGEGPVDPEGALEWLMERQLPDGGWAYAVGLTRSDPDMTGMALLALRALGVPASHRAVQRAVECLRRMQLPDGGFAGWGVDANAESTAMALVGLVAAGKNPLAGGWPGPDPLKALFAYRLEGGAFAHVADGPPDPMATRQALLALADCYYGTPFFARLTMDRWRNSFRDVPPEHWAAPALADLARRGILRGYPDGTCRPDEALTRAEFVSLVVRAYHPAAQTSPAVRRFADVPVTHWAAPAVYTARELGLVRGLSEDLFGPDEPVTGGQVMTVLSRAAGDSGSREVGGPWWAGFVELARERGWLYPGFAPDSQASRAECAWALARATAR
ncbi:MAG: S-layer homology domain-containing protein [Firmicutes bacterium]|nr:S-layer homology domain-containing protein [Bacillota bacterium]